MATLVKTLDSRETASQELDRWIEAKQKKSLLRFITCGSVDDGKSTLIGRLLYDSRLLFEDQLSALANESRSQGTQGDALDFALLVDGLAAEREQGITIDVAYRFFTTDKRKFIVADTPGHEQYTRNMVTGASTADAALILVDARKGILPQTKRHSLLAHLLGIRQLVLAVNKMDLIDHDERVFERICADYEAFARQAGIGEFTAIPVSGLNGDNVIGRSLAMDWYRGPVLLEHLEMLPASLDASQEPFRMAVQWVSRPSQNFRGYAGRIASGRVNPGDAVTILPSGRKTFVERIVTRDGDLDLGLTGQSVTLTLSDDVDCSRGDLIVAADAEIRPVSRIDASLVWMSDEKLVPHRSYWLKVGAKTVSASIAVSSITNVDGFAETTGETLCLNEIGKVEIDIDLAIPAVRYRDNRKLGGFILIDKMSHATIAAGLIEDLPTNVGSQIARGLRSDSICWVSGPDRASWAAAAVRRLRSQGQPAMLIDHAAVAAFPGDEPIGTAREIARLVASAGVTALITIEASPDQAHPGRTIDSSDRPEEGSEWVI